MVTETGFHLFQSKKSSPGKLVVHEAVARRTYSFLDYISGGTQMNCTIAIDFTGIVT